MENVKTEYYSVSDVAVILGCSRNNVYNLIKKKEIDSIKLGDKYFIPRNFMSRNNEKK